MVQFLRGALKRLAGPVTPITYLRTADYREPYTDYARIGRLALLRAREFQPWHSGVPHIFIAPAARMPEREYLGYVPGGVALQDAASILAAVRDRDELREAFGNREYDEACGEQVAELERLNQECQQAEQMAVPLRVLYQTGTPETQMRLRVALERAELTEQDFCAAWHHLPPQKRERLKEALPALAAWIK
jgi:hypothetical protein